MINLDKKFSFQSVSSWATNVSSQSDSSLKKMQDVAGFPAT